MPNRNIAPTAQWEERSPGSATALPVGLFAVESGGVWGWSDTGPADGATVTVGGVTYVDEGETVGLAALEVADTLLVI